MHYCINCSIQIYCQLSFIAKDIATPVSARNTQQSCLSSIIKLRTTKSTFLCTAGNESESPSSSKEIPKTPRASVPAEIRQLILPPITRAQNKGTFRMESEESNHQVDPNCSEARASHQNFFVPQVRHKAVFPAPESANTATTPTVLVTGPEKPHSYTLSVPSRSKSIQPLYNSHAEILSNANPTKSSSIFKSIETNANSLDREMQSLDPGMTATCISMGNYSENTHPNTNYAVTPTKSHETCAMNINSSGNCMDTTCNVASQNLIDSLQPASANGTSSGSWFDNWGLENSIVHPDQQGFFPLNPNPVSNVI